MMHSGEARADPKLNDSLREETKWKFSTGAAVVVMFTCIHHWHAVDYLHAVKVYFVVVCRYDVTTMIAISL